MLNEFGTTRERGVPITHRGSVDAQQELRVRNIFGLIVSKFSWKKYVYRSERTKVCDVRIQALVTPWATLHFELRMSAVWMEAPLMINRNSSMQLTRAADYGVRVMIHLVNLPVHQRALLPALAAGNGSAA